MVEPIRFGPVAQEHRFERIFYWPDPKGLGTRQIREVLAKQDKSVTEQTGLAGKSVALQGLPALEYLLYGDGAATLEKGGAEGTFRCSFAEAVAGNLAGIAKEIVDGWQDGAPYAKSYLEPGPANPAYHTAKEVTLELFKTFTAGIEWVRDQKLGKAARAKARAGKAASLRRSGGAGRASPTWPAISQACATCSPKAGSRKWCIKSRPASRIRSCSTSTTPSRSCAASTSPSPKRCATRMLRGKLEALRISLKAAATTAGDMISRGAGLTFGFNAMDGD